MVINFVHSSSFSLSNCHWLTSSGRANCSGVNAKERQVWDADKFKNNLLGNFFAGLFEGPRFSEYTCFRWTNPRIRFDVYARLVDTLSRESPYWLDARQAAKCKPRIGWLFARHYQVYQMLMRGEARYSSICLNGPSRASLTRGPISHRTSQRLNSRLHKRLRSRLLIVRFIRRSWYSSCESKMNPGLMCRMNLILYLFPIPIKRSTEYAVQSDYLVYANQFQIQLKLWNSTRIEFFVISRE